MFLICLLAIVVCQLVHGVGGAFADEFVICQGFQVTGLALQESLYFRYHHVFESILILFDYTPLYSSSPQ